LQKNLHALDLRLLLPDVTTIADEADSHLTQANGLGTWMSCGRQQQRYSAAIKRGKDNEDEDMDGGFQHGQTSRP
jgi:hypothetical protein